MLFNIELFNKNRLIIWYLNKNYNMLKMNTETVIRNMFLILESDPIWRPPWFQLFIL